MKLKSLTNTLKQFVSKSKKFGKNCVLSENFNTVFIKLNKVTYFNLHLTILHLDDNKL